MFLLHLYSQIKFSLILHIFCQDSSILSEEFSEYKPFLILCLKPAWCRCFFSITAPLISQTISSYDSFCDCFHTCNYQHSLVDYREHVHCSCSRSYSLTYWLSWVKWWVFSILGIDYIFSVMARRKLLILKERKLVGLKYIFNSKYNEIMQTLVGLFNWVIECTFYLHCMDVIENTVETFKYPTPHKYMHHKFQQIWLKKLC